MSLLPELCAFVGETNDCCRGEFQIGQLRHSAARTAQRAQQREQILRYRPAIIALALACTACGRSEPTNADQPAPSVVIPEADPRDIPPSLKPGGLPADSNSLPEGPIDPKSAQGAGQVVQHFAALLEQKRFGEASILGEDDFTAALDRKAEIHAEIGAPGEIEGAAGSLYVQVPIRFYGTLGTGKPFSQRATATLRRVNDVPGSTEQQRQWRIYRLDMQQAE